MVMRAHDLLERVVRRWEAEAEMGGLIKFGQDPARTRGTKIKIGHRRRPPAFARNTLALG